MYCRFIQSEAAHRATESLAESIVKVIDVVKNAAAKNQVNFVIAVAADLPDIKPPSDPPVDPRPPPSERCIKTTLINTSAKMR